MRTQVMTYSVIDRRHFKQGSANYIVLNHLYPLAEGSEMITNDFRVLAEGSKKVVNHVKRPTIGRFVMFHRFSPLVEGLGFEVRQKNALKIGQKVMRDDLHPLAEGWKVVAKDFWVLAEGSEEVVKDFWVPAEGSGIIANDFRPIVLKCFLLER